ncbi:LOW QUALITY PROTEIN: hypothetical protein Nmel_014840 [Mimus melanotis]
MVPMSPDLPGVLSPPYVEVLDPECQVLPGAGKHWDISETQDLPGLFEPFWAESCGTTPCLSPGHPLLLPPSPQPSEIAAGLSDPEHICNLIQTCLTEAPLAFLFLCHVCRVALHRVAPDGVQTLMGTLVASPQPVPVPVPSRELSLEMLPVIATSAEDATPLAAKGDSRALGIPQVGQPSNSSQPVKKNPQPCGTTWFWCVRVMKTCWNYFTRTHRQDSILHLPWLVWPCPLPLPKMASGCHVWMLRRGSFLPLCHAGHLRTANPPAWGLQHPLKSQGVVGPREAGQVELGAAPHCYADGPAPGTLPSLCHAQGRQVGEL